MNFIFKNKSWIDHTARFLHFSRFFVQDFFRRSKEEVFRSDPNLVRGCENSNWPCHHRQKMLCSGDLKHPGFLQASILWVIVRPGQSRPNRGITVSTGTTMTAVTRISVPTIFLVLLHFPIQSAKFSATWETLICPDSRSLTDVLTNWTIRTIISMNSERC
jgi:hypothetical protein